MTVQVNVEDLVENMSTNYGIIVDVMVEEDEVILNINTGTDSETNTGEEEIEQFMFDVGDTVLVYN